MLDMDGCIAHLHQDITKWLQAWLPDGWKSDGHYVADLEERGLVRINVDTAAWSLTRGDTSGTDLLSLYCFLHGAPIERALQRLHPAKCGLSTLSADGPVVIVSTLADAAECLRLVPAYSPLLWPGLIHCWEDADYARLAGRKALLLPKPEDEGFMRAFGQKSLLGLVGEVKLCPQDGPALASFDTPGFIAWARGRARTLTAPEPPIVPPAPTVEAPPAAATPKRRPPRLTVVPNQTDGNTALKPDPNALPDGLPPEYSDDALALAFTAAHPDMRYVNAWGKWLNWNGRQWAIDTTLAVFDRARLVCRQFAEQASHNPTLSPSQQTRIASHIASAKTIANVERLARADPRHASSPDLWDADPWLLNTPAGTLHLQTGKLHPHRQSDHITRCTACSPSSQAPATWLAFLSRVLNGDDALAAYLQRLAGYCLTGLTREHSLGFFYGTGGNGKGTFLNTLTAIMADYAAVASMDSFTENKTTQHPADLAMLRGARLVTAQETEAGKHWNEQRITSLTGGDPITARFMRQDFFTYIPQFKLIIAGNHKPRLKSINEAIRRRMHLVPFTQTIPESERDPTLPDRLREEWPQILGWAVAGCLQWQQARLDPPSAVLEATNTYLTDEDRLGAWITECCDVKPSHAGTHGDLYASYERWCDRNKESKYGGVRFGNEMEQRGFSRLARAERRERGYSGIRLADQAIGPPSLPGSPPPYWQEEFPDE